MPLYNGSTKIARRFYVKTLTKPLILTDFEAYLQKSLTTFKTPVSINRLRDYCFYNFDGLETVELTKQIQSLGQNCFEGCLSLQKVWLPNTCKTIGANCFLSVPETCTIYTDTMLDLDGWDRTWKGSATVLYGKTYEDFLNG